MTPSMTRSAAKREAILLAATDLFLERGYNGVSIDAIVEQVGGTKANIYTHFGGKEGLFRAIISNCCQEILAPLSRIDSANLSPRETLTAIGHHYLSIILSEKTLALYRLVIAESTQFPELGQIFFAAGPECSRQGLANYLTTQQQMGNFAPCDARQAAAMFFNMLAHDIQLQLLLRIASRPSNSAINTLVDDVVNAFLRANISKSALKELTFKESIFEESAALSSRMTLF